MLSDQHTLIPRSLLSFLLLGIIYQTRFQSRTDWSSLADIFSTEHMTTKFVETGKIIENSLHVQRSKEEYQPELRMLGALGPNRLLRIIDDETIIFRPTKGQFSLDEFYLYPCEIDYGLYRHLPPFAAQVLSPFEYYFEVNCRNLDIFNRNVTLIKPTITTHVGALGVRSISIEAGSLHQPTVVRIDFSPQSLVEINLMTQELILTCSDRGHECARFLFNDVADNLENIFNFTSRY